MNRSSAGMTPTAVAEPAAWWRRPAWQVAMLALLLAFGFLGSRPIWDPDEGRYSNVAMMMLDSGDWIDLARHRETGHWTKPPLTYWLVAASIGTFGATPWAARLPVALAYLACVWLAWRGARRLWPAADAPAGAADAAAIAASCYATLLLPVVASQVLTTDFVLSAFQGLAMVAWLEARFGPREKALRWLFAAWAAFALAFMTKGPPALLPLLAVVALQWLAPMPRPFGARAWLTGIAIFFLIALPWYVAVVLRHDGLLAYFLGTEVYKRVAGDMGRNGGWYGWLEIYLPTLLLGTLPWTLPLLRGLRDWRSRLPQWRTRAGRQADARRLQLALWLALPLLVFCISRSRLPLYLLPLFLPLALLIAGQWQGEARPAPRRRWILAWVALILSGRLFVAQWPTNSDAASWAQTVRERTSAPITEVVFVEDFARYGMHLYLDAEVEKLSLDSGEPTGYTSEYDESVASELRSNEAGAVWITHTTKWPRVREELVRAGFAVEVLGEPYRDRVIFRVRDPAP
ncbi:ArnT family glycosyltransferase [Tahibacter caeni]|uniref:ArnT family glycosyltransferase n=1 Tax=Tahibacter caeni TaxID=1453545 RepID=UPI00214950F3|nr:glycosyltransferase family 39 protein [Tahibacter caeni]